MSDPIPKTKAYLDRRYPMLDGVILYNSFMPTNYLPSYCRGAHNFGYDPVTKLYGYKNDHDARVFTAPTMDDLIVKVKLITSYLDGKWYV